MFALFGAGWENILLPFQMTFTGSLVFGLAYLLLADHDGPFDRRDALGLLAGLFALMCSGVGIVMVAVVGAAVLARRGLRLALLHVVPLASAYAIWLIVIGHTDNQVGHFRPLDVMRFVRTGLLSAFGAIGPVIGIRIRARRHARGGAHARVRWVRPVRSPQRSWRHRARSLRARWCCSRSRR